MCIRDSNSVGLNWQNGVERAPRAALAVVLDATDNSRAASKLVPSDVEFVADNRADASSRSLRQHAANAQRRLSSGSLADNADQSGDSFDRLADGVFAGW